VIEGDSLKDYIDRWTAPIEKRMEEWVKQGGDRHLYQVKYTPLKEGEVRMKYLIRRMGNILGTYEGKSEVEALNELAMEEGFKDFDEACNKLGLVRDNYTVTQVKDL